MDLKTSDDIIVKGDIENHYRICQHFQQTEYNFEKEDRPQDRSREWASKGKDVSYTPQGPKACT